jgi:hypothetical protein
VAKVKRKFHFTTSSLIGRFFRSFERILGSLIGAIFAEITVYAASVVDSDGLAIAFTFGFLFYFLGTYLQHSTAYDRPYSL